MFILINWKGISVKDEKLQLTDFIARLSRYRNRRYSDKKYRHFLFQRVVAMTWDIASGWRSSSGAINTSRSLTTHVSLSGSFWLYSLLLHSDCIHVCIHVYKYTVH